MPFDVNGNFSLVPGTLVTTGDTVLPSQHNPAMQDFASGFSQVLVRDGRAPFTGDIDAAGFRLRNIGNGVDPGDAVTFGQLPEAIEDTLPAVKASNSNVWQGTEDKIFTTDRIPSASAPVALTEGTPIPIDWQTFVCGYITLTANRQFQNPTNVQPGTQRIIRIAGNNATDRTVTWGNQYKGPFPTGALNNVDGFIVTLWAFSATEIHVFWKSFQAS